MIIWCAVHANKVIGLNYFHNETVRVNYSQKLETFVQSEAQQFPWASVFHQQGAPFHITRTIRSLLDEMFPNSLNEIYDPTDWPEQPPDFTELDVFFLGLLKDRVYYTSVPYLTQPKRRLPRATRTVNQKNLNYAWISLETDCMLSRIR